MKVTPRELELHLAIKGKSDIALSRLYEMHGVQIVRILKSKYHSTAKRDEALIFDAVNEAFLGYFNNSGTFNPEKYKLFTFLLVAADRDLQNLLVKERKHLNRKDLPEDVELQEIFWNSIMKAHSSADDTIHIDETMTAIQKILENLFSTDQDVELAWMVLANVRETEPYSEILGIEMLEISEQQAEVKKIKDRIKIVLKRNDVENKIKSLIR